MPVCRMGSGEKLMRLILTEWQYYPAACEGLPPTRTEFSTTAKQCETGQQAWTPCFLVARMFSLRV